MFDRNKRTLVYYNDKSEVRFCLISVGDPAPFLTGSRLPPPKKKKKKHYYKFILTSPAPYNFLLAPASAKNVLDPGSSSPTLVSIFFLFFLFYVTETCTYQFLDKN